MKKEIPDINKRFLQIIEYKGYSGYKLSKEVKEITESKLTHIRSGRNEPSKEMILALLNKFQDVNSSWLLMGEGEMLNENQESSNVIINNSLPKVINNNVNVPYYDVDFAGGWDSDEMFSNQLPAFNITSPDFAKAEFACNLVGNSISNRIPNGAIIGLREIFNWQIYFPTNELYGVLTKNDLRTVKIVKRSKKSGYLTLMPDPLEKFNQTGYEPEEIPMEFVTKFFQVVAWACFEKVAM